MIQVVVEIVAKAGQREAVLKAFKANVPAVHAERAASNIRHSSTRQASARWRPMATIPLSSSKNGNRPPT